MTTIRLDTLAYLWDQFEADVLDAEGVLNEELAAQHEALQLAEPDAIDNFALYVRSLEATQEGLVIVERELSEKRSVLAKRVEALKKIAFKIVEARGAVSTKSGSRTLKGALYTLAVQANGGVEPLAINENAPIGAWPSQFTKRILDPEAIRGWLQPAGAGAKIVAENKELILAELLPRGRHLRIR